MGESGTNCFTYEHTYNETSSGIICSASVSDPTRSGNTAGTYTVRVSSGGGGGGEFLMHVMPT